MSKLYKDNLISWLLSAELAIVLLNGGMNDGARTFNDLEGVVSEPITLSGKAVADGLFMANDVKFNNITSEHDAAAIYIKDDGRLLALADEHLLGDGDNPKGGEVSVELSRGIFRI